jgi:serine/threonine protein phosphatase PrpC
MRKVLLWCVLPLLLLASLTVVTLHLAKGHTASKAAQAESALFQQGKQEANSKWYSPPPQKSFEGNGAPPQIALDTYSGKPEQAFGFAGNGFAPNEHIELRLDTSDAPPAINTSQLLATGVANLGGNVAGRGVVPFLPAGDYPLLVVGPQNQRILTRNFTILGFSPWVVLDNYAPFAHVLLGFRGEDFAPGETVQVHLDQVSNQPILQVNAGIDGQFVARKAVESPEQLGDHSLIFVGSRSGITAKVSFIVEAAPTKPALSASIGRFAPAMAGGLPGRSLAGTAVSLQPATSSVSVLGDFSLQDPMTLVLLVLGGWLALCLLLVLPLMIAPLLPRRQTKRPVEERQASLAQQAGGFQASAEANFAPGAERMPIPASSVLLPDLPPDRPSAAQPVYPALPASAYIRQGADTTLRHDQPRLQLGMQVSSASDRGATHAHRENGDRFLSVTGTRSVAGQLQPFGLFVVADGISNQASGSEASSLTIDTIYQRIVPLLPREELGEDDLLMLLAATIRHANMLLYRRSHDQGYHLGCTVTASLVTGDEVAFCHVGKSRAYLLAPQDPLRRVTVDHSLVEGLVVGGLIQREDVYTHPMRNRIYRCLGHGPQVEIDTLRLNVASGNQLLLCSDGLWQMLRDPIIEEVLRQAPDICQANKTLVGLANERGGLDNITTILIKMTDEARSIQRPGIGRVNSNQIMAPR